MRGTVRRSASYDIASRADAFFSPGNIVTSCTPIRELSKDCKRAMQWSVSLGMSGRSGETSSSMVRVIAYCFPLEIDRSRCRRPVSLQVRETLKGTSEARILRNESVNVRPDLPALSENSLDSGETCA